MKKLIGRCMAHPWRFCYSVGALLLALWLAGNAGLDALCFAAGRLRTEKITLADTGRYLLVNMEQVDDTTLLARNGDAQLHLITGQRVRSLRVVGQLPTGAEKDLYYHLPGMGYSPLFRVWPESGPDGTEERYLLPQLTGSNLRLDLADTGGTEVTVQEIVINEPRLLAARLVPSLWQLFWLLILPGLAASAVEAMQRSTGRQKCETKTQEQKTER